MSGHSDEPADWSRERAEQTALRICDPTKIRGHLQQATEAAPEAIREALARAKGLAGLHAPDVAALLQVRDPALRAEILDTAGGVHEQTYGRRIRLVAPVCPTNRCVNDCEYCPLRRSNARLRRDARSTHSLQRDIAALLDEGYRQVQLVFGDDRSGIHYVRDNVWAAYGTRSGHRQLQLVDINLNPPRATDLQQLKTSGRLGTYSVLQETYDPGTYAALHPDGPKSDYAWRITGHDRAFQVGIEDVGIGVLLGLGDYRFDVLATLSHSEYLKGAYGKGPNTISYPRLLPSPGAPASLDTTHAVSDDDLCFVVAVTRLADPHTHIVLSTPAPRDVRIRLYGLGVSQVIVGSSSYPGVYTGDGLSQAGGTLTIGRSRALENLVYRMCEAGFVPNLCVACYMPQRRRSAASAASREFAQPQRCLANSLLALKEYGMDYASADTQAVIERLVQRDLGQLSEGLRNLTLELMEEAEAGLRGQIV